MTSFGDEAWSTASALAVRVLSASDDYMFDMTAVSNSMMALVPKFKSACVLGPTDLTGAHAALLNKRCLEAVPLKTATNMCMLCVQGSGSLTRFCIVAVDTLPNSLVFICDNGNWMHIGNMPSVREARAAVSMFELGGLLIAQALCERLLVRGNAPRVVPVSEHGATLKCVHHIQRNILSAMAAADDMTVTSTVMSDEEDGDTIAVDDVKFRHENMRLETLIGRLTTKTPVSRILSTFLWFARINMSRSKLEALYDLLSAAWVPPPFTLEHFDSKTMQSPAGAVRVRSTSTEAVLTCICEWVLAAPPVWRARFIAHLGLFTNLVTNKWK